MPYFYDFSHAGSTLTKADNNRKANNFMREPLLYLSLRQKRRSTSSD